MAVSSALAAGREIQPRSEAVVVTANTRRMVAESRGAASPKGATSESTKSRSTANVGVRRVSTNTSGLTLGSRRRAASPAA